jgi:hypothetical protein
MRSLNRTTCIGVLSVSVGAAGLVGSARASCDYPVPGSAGGRAVEHERGAYKASHDAADRQDDAQWWLGTDKAGTPWYSRKSLVNEHLRLNERGTYSVTDVLDYEISRKATGDLLPVGVDSDIYYLPRVGRDRLAGVGVMHGHRGRPEG